MSVHLLTPFLFSFPLSSPSVLSIFKDLQSIVLEDTSLGSLSQKELCTFKSSKYFTNSAYSALNYSCVMLVLASYGSAGYLRPDSLGLPEQPEGVFWA